MYDRVGLYRGKKSLCCVNNSKRHLTKRFMVGIFLLIVGLATSIASAIYFWKAASQLSRSVTAQH